MRELRPTISVKDLIDAGLIMVPCTALGNYHGIHIEADLDRSGEFRWRGRQFTSPSAAAAHALTGATGRRTPGRAYLSVNGWIIWTVLAPCGDYRLLTDVRQQYRDLD